MDAGFSCPNRDGKTSTAGCIYCDNRSFSFHSREGKKLSLKDQISSGIEAARKRFKAEKFIVYFQAHTNTYAPLNRLKEKYDTIRGFKDVVGLAIGTRPDCVNDQILSLISSYANDYDVWIEYGLQSIHNETLERINRGHSYEDFLNTYNLTRLYPIKICVHVILGLPGETKVMMIHTAEEIKRLKVDAIKICPLYIVKDTPIEVLYKKGEYVPLKLEEYNNLLYEFLLHLHRNIIVQRINAFCPKDILVAPDWVCSR